MWHSFQSVNKNVGMEAILSQADIPTDTLTDAPQIVIISSEQETSAPVDVNPMQSSETFGNVEETLPLDQQPKDRPKTASRKSSQADLVGKHFEQGVDNHDTPVHRPTTTQTTLSSVPSTISLAQLPPTDRLQNLWKQQKLVLESIDMFNLITIQMKIRKYLSAMY